MMFPDGFAAAATPPFLLDHTPEKKDHFLFSSLLSHPFIPCGSFCKRQTWMELRTIYTVGCRFGKKKFFPFRSHERFLSRLSASQCCYSRDSFFPFLLLRYPCDCVIPNQFIRFPGCQVTGSQVGGRSRNEAVSADDETRVSPFSYLTWKSVEQKDRS